MLKYKVDKQQNLAQSGHTGAMASYSVFRCQSSPPSSYICGSCKFGLSLKLTANQLNENQHPPTIKSSGPIHSEADEGGEAL